APPHAASSRPPAGRRESFTFQTASPVTNALTGSATAPVDIPAGQPQTYITSLTPTGALAPTEVAFTYGAENTTAPATTLPGVNTLLLSSSFSAIPDLVALAATAGNDGIVNIPGNTGTGAFAVATINDGSSGS